MSAKEDKSSREAFAIQMRILESLGCAFVRITNAAKLSKNIQWMHPSFEIFKPRLKTSVCQEKARVLNAKFKKRRGRRNRKAAVLCNY